MCAFQMCDKFAQHISSTLIKLSPNENSKSNLAIMNDIRESSGCGCHLRWQIGTKAEIDNCFSVSAPAKGSANKHIQLLIGVYPIIAMEFREMVSEIVFEL